MVLPKSNEIFATEVEIFFFRLLHWLARLKKEKHWVQSLVVRIWVSDIRRDDIATGMELAYHKL